MKPLTIEELKKLKVGDWVWVVSKEPTLKDYFRIRSNTFSFYVNNELSRDFSYSDYGTKWLAYKNKEQAEAKGEIVELPCIRDLSRRIGTNLYEVVFIQFGGTVQGETYSLLSQAEARLAELKGE